MEQEWRERVGQLWHEVRYAVRALRRTPSFTLTAVLTAAVGIGAATAICSISTTLLLHPLPYDDAGQLVHIIEHVPVDVSPGYLRAIGARLIAGRWLDARDGIDAPRSLLVNQSLAAAFFGQQNPIGQTIGIGMVRWRRHGHERHRGQRPGRPAVLCGAARAFALVAGAIAAVGLYAWLTHAVVLRRRELGVRMALGATSRAIMQMVFRDAGFVAVSGLAAGAAGAPLLTGLLRQLLFGIETTDAAVVAEVIALVLGVAMLAAYAPPRRATRVDPMTAIRADTP